MNRVYEIEEGRPFWKLRPLMILITLAAVILAGLVAIGLVVSGPVAGAIGDAIGLGEHRRHRLEHRQMAGHARPCRRWWWRSCTTPPPTCKQPKFRWISLGAVVAILTWVIASALFGFYVSHFSNYNKTYGSLAGVIIFLLWLWITNLALLFGAELDAEMERGRQLQAGIAAEDDTPTAAPGHQGQRQEPPRKTPGTSNKESNSAAPTATTARRPPDADSGAPHLTAPSRVHWLANTGVARSADQPVSPAVRSAGTDGFPVGDRVPSASRSMGAAAALTTGSGRRRRCRREVRGG